MKSPFSLVCFLTGLCALLFSGCAPMPPKQIAAEDRIKFVRALIAATQSNHVVDAAYMAETLNINVTKRSEVYDWSKNMMNNNYRIYDRYGRLSSSSTYSNLSNKDIAIDHFWNLEPQNDFCITREDIREAGEKNQFLEQKIMVSMKSGDNNLTFMFKDGSPCSYGISATNYAKKAAS
ncbi:hypothetical protein [Ralstonia sp. NFACC01]|jgi:hypothetical protein|uniref:hypothetical protein n=1 Tax=Ralstonia sp. NFACC01 TaxID=1566294 RepID=UPI0008E44026|nr:hypothetical protein [Ralstonia sp. NFACC01]SFP98005.1 hypothetical protein SAMN03159417_03861 [Ralstonia sp. NFACC01]